MISLPGTPGLDFCGRVVAKHPSNNDATEGQLVFGALSKASRFGTLGQFTLVSSSECAPLPDGIDPDDAAAVGTAAATAYQSLLPDVLKPGWKVFINGGSGGVGTWAIQFAKAMGAEVTTTCSTDNVDLCRQLGADKVIDYKKVAAIPVLKEIGPVFDLVIDNVGSSELYNESNTLLKPGGTFVLVGTGVSATEIATNAKRQLLPSFLNAGRKYHFVMVKSQTEYYAKIGEWMVNGKARAIVDETFEWEDVPAAFSRLREGHSKGKIIIHVGKK